MTEKILWQNEWATVMDRDGWTVVRDMDGAGVAVLPYKREGGELWFLARMEPCPAHGPEIHSGSLTGAIQEGESPELCAVRELAEEAGYSASEDALAPLGDVWPSKLVEFRIHMFAVNVSGMVPTSPKGDGSKWEAMSSNVWLNGKQATTVPDAVWGTMVLRLKAKF